MFENVLGQSAVEQLTHDIKQNRLAPAMLFYGPPASAKGTSALELARFISCENTDGERAPWNCSCPSCLQHKLLLNPDLICLGSKNFSAEIAASARAFLNENGNPGSQMLFFRAVRKLLMRFNPVLWEDESKLSKINPLVSSIEEELELCGNAEKKQGSTLEKITASITENSLKLESEGITETIPIAQIRRVASWAHLHPAGNGKTLVIENADRMQEGARNSLLKLLEEPPEKVTLILTVTRQKVLLPTILSRLRPYRFAERNEETEKDVIRRVFRCSNFSGSGGGKNKTGQNIIGSYLDSFLPVSADVLENIAAFFTAAAARKAALMIMPNSGYKDNAVLPEIIATLGKDNTAIAEKAGFNQSAKTARETVSFVLSTTKGFELRYLFSGFLRALLVRISESEKQIPLSSPKKISFYRLWKECTLRADNAVSVYNQTPALALERLFSELSSGMAEICANS